ncbi:MAG: hypothetical protein ACRES1_06845, partial [Steroidobacteraceae bacterium]
GPTEPARSRESEEAARRRQESRPEVACAKGRGQAARGTQSGRQEVGQTAGAKIHPPPVGLPPKWRLATVRKQIIKRPEAALSEIR